MDQKLGNRIYTLKIFVGFLTDLIEHLGDLRKTPKAGRVSKAFSERIMLAVTQVNGCRYCSYVHTQSALKAGMSEKDIQSLLNGELGDVPERETVALMFAQHYAESAGQPDPAAYQRLLDIYGSETSRDILAHIRAIMVGNTYGNSLDAFRSRLKSAPFPGSSIGQELGIVVGTFFLLPVIVIQTWVSNLFRPKSKASPETTL